MGVSAGMVTEISAKPAIVVIAIRRRRRPGPTRRPVIRPRPAVGSPRRRLGSVRSYDEQVAKLRLIVETAQEVWG